MTLGSPSNDKILDVTKFKAYADNKLTHSHTTKFWTRPNSNHLQTTNVTKMIVSVSEKVENIVGNGEIPCLEG